MILGGGEKRGQITSDTGSGLFFKTAHYPDTFLKHAELVPAATRARDHAAVAAQELHSATRKES
jgi:hypothetical protein